MADIAKVKRNIQRMIDQGAPEQDIDAYVASEGVTVEDLQKSAPPKATAPQQPAPQQEYSVSHSKTDMPAPNAAYWGTGSQALDVVTMGLANKGGAAMNGLIDATIGAVKGDGFNYSDNYNKWLEWQRSNQRLYNDENPIRSGLGTAAGVALGVASMPVFGRGLLGAAGTGAAYGGVGGAAQDADTVNERVGNALLGTVAGTAIGGAGYGIGKVAAKGLERGADALSVLRAPPAVKAASEVYGAADDKFGPYNAMSMSRAINDLGPDAINADVLGKRGYALGRSAANMSPEARQTLEDIVQARKSGQNVRLATDVETAAGLPVGSTKNVDALKADAYAKVRPQINSAYDAARKAGAEIPFEAFDNIITTPVGQKAFKQALDNMTSRAARDPSQGGNLAVLDETKRLLDGWATEAYLKADPMADVYAETAKALREQVDNFLANGDQYATARALRQGAYKAAEAFDLGAELGGSRVGLGVPEKVAKLPPELKPNVSKAYGATKVQSLLNKPSTEGAYNELITPQGQKAASAALEKPSLLANGIKREKVFNVTNREVVGNASTARQLLEAGGAGLGTAAVGTLLGFDPTTSTAAGIAAGVGRKMAPAITQRLVTENQRKVAPYIANLLAAHGMPTNQVLPMSQLTSVIQRYLTAGDAKMAKALALIWNYEVQNTNPQMNPAR